MLQEARRRQVFAVGTACGAALLVCLALLASPSSSASTPPVSLFQDVTGNEDQFVDPALIRLSDDPWFTSRADAQLTHVARELARTRLQEVILARVNRMTHGDPNASGDLEKLVRVAEEQVIYDHWIIKHLTAEVAHKLSPIPRETELREVRTLEEELKAKMMQSLGKEAIREINLLVDATDESPHIKKITKDRLLERTQALLMPQVEGRVVRFIESRIPKCAHAGVRQVLKYLAHSVNEEEKRELLGGPIVPGVDYSFENKAPNSGDEAAMSSTEKMVLAHNNALRKSLLTDQSQDAAPPQNLQAPAAGNAAAGNNDDDGTNINIGLVIFVVALLAVIGLLAML